MTERRFAKPNGPVIRLTAAVALVAASACAAPIGAAGTDTSETVPPVRCGIATETRAGATAFRPWVAVAHGQAGSYRFVLDGAGATINQGGGFEAGPDRAVTLGEALLSGPASAYAARLTVTVDGRHYDCRAGTGEL